MSGLPFTFEPMPLLGVVVDNFEGEIARYETIFRVKFKVFTAGVDYALEYEPSAGGDTSTPLPAQTRLAVDTNDLFELVEIPGAPEGIRNIHYRVEDLDEAVAHFVSEGLELVQVVQAGNAREAIFDATSLNGVRLCLMEFEGPSFAEALAASPRPS